MIYCPQCNHTNLSRLHRHFWDKVLSFLFNLYPFICDNCGHRFRAKHHPVAPPTLD